MSIKTHVEQATAEFKERQLNWTQFAAHSIEVLDLTERHSNLTDVQRASLKEYLLFRKRERKAELEILEKQSDYLERSALPVAVTFFSVVTWLLVEVFQVSIFWRHLIQVPAFAIAAGGWYFARVLALRRISAAREHLARLGKVD